MKSVNQNVLQSESYAINLLSTELNCDQVFFFASAVAKKKLCLTSAVMARDYTGRMSAHGVFCMELAYLEPISTTLDVETWD